jgi:hypothetical protein
MNSGVNVSDALKHLSRIGGVKNAYLQLKTTKDVLIKENALLALANASFESVETVTEIVAAKSGLFGFVFSVLEGELRKLYVSLIV